MLLLTLQIKMAKGEAMPIHFDTPVQYIKGVGPKLGDVLRKRGVGTVEQLLEWYPRAYEDRRAVRNIASLEADQIVSITAQILKVRSIPMGRSHRKMYEVLINDSTGRIACKYFRVPYKGYFERFEPYQKVKVMGKVTRYRHALEFHHPDIHPVPDDGEEDQQDLLIPLYTETEGLSPQKLRKMIDTALGHLEKGEENEVLPQWLLEKYKLIPRFEALKQIHQPPVEMSDQFLKLKSPAHRRLIFEEFFWLELRLALKRAGVEREKAMALKAKGDLAQKLQLSLPFELTRAQQKVFKEVVDDLQKPHPMHRLIQGDVGSGKTLVALMAASHAIEAKSQVALMVPTEILAEQHYKNATQLLSPLGVEVALLTGHMKNSEKQKIYEELADGKIHLCIGTHALIQETVDFKNLGLVVIDEQHRFGVHQRQKLKSKGLSPHFLVMTATPIPRTLAMTVYGDLDVSVIDELPKGRQAIVTRKTFDSKRPQVLGFVAEQIQKGRQAYIVYPLVEESEKMDLKNATEEYQKIKEQFPDLRVGLLHGRMKPFEKEEIMKAFRDQRIDILVATTVIEVGVDVPNANIMVIEHAERFGLSQLHQLRGRVGRGEYKSYCVLVLGYAASEEARQRAEIMESTADGFKVAEADLELRGPGEFLGTRQSGLPGFKLANLVRDTLILQDARQAAFELIRRDPNLQTLDQKALKEEWVG